MADCLFCKIAKKEISSETVWEDADVVVFKDMHPRAPVHLLLVPRLHIASANEARKEHEPTLGKLFSAARLVAEQVGVHHSGYRLIVNTGPDGGQVIDHLHMHLLGGRKIGPKGEEM